jgi:hypothetical protein
MGRGATSAGPVEPAGGDRTVRGGIAEAIPTGAGDRDLQTIAHGPLRGPGGRGAPRTWGSRPRLQAGTPPGCSRLRGLWRTEATSRHGPDREICMRMRTDAPG